MLKKQFQQFVTYFFPKRKVWSYGYPTGIFQKASLVKGAKYITIAVTNVAGGKAIIFHVPLKKVIGIQLSITPFQRWWFAKVVCKPLPSYNIKPIKK